MDYALEHTPMPRRLLHSSIHIPQATTINLQGLPFGFI